MPELFYKDSGTENNIPFGIKEEIFSVAIKPYYVGFVTFAPNGRVAWQNPQNRCSYKIEPDGKEARILDVVVQERYQGQDIGRKLVQIAERRFREHGVTRVTGWADQEVHGFWRKLGYEVLPSNDILKQL